MILNYIITNFEIFSGRERVGIMLFVLQVGRIADLAALKSRVCSAVCTSCTQFFEHVKT